MLECDARWDVREVGVAAHSAVVLAFWLVHFDTNSRAIRFGGVHANEPLYNVYGQSMTQHVH